MHWPLVWASTYYAAMHDIRKLEDQLHEERARHGESQRLAATTLQQLAKIENAIIANYAELANPKPLTATKTAIPLAVPERDEIADAIMLVSGVDKGLARHLQKWAKQQTLEGVDEHHIIQSILHWDNANAWDGEEEDTPSFL